MENTNASKYINSFGLSLAVASVIDGLLVIAKEKAPAVMSGMKTVTGHHWITHSAFIVSLFVLCGWLFAQSNGKQGPRLAAKHLIGTLVSGVAIGSLIIVGFYLICG